MFTEIWSEKTNDRLIIKLLSHLNFLKNIYTKLFKMANTERFAQKPQWPLKKKKLLKTNC